jgi:uncharacterized protein (TIGR03435 family)
VRHNSTQTVLALLGAMLVVVPLLSQTTPTAFEVASVKRNDSATNRSSTSMLPGGRFLAIFTTLDRQIINAYRIKDYQLSGGPSWVYSERYDIEAKADGNTSRDQMRLMIQGLLTERFRLEMHQEKKDIPVYALVAGKNRTGLQAAPDRATSGFETARGRITGQGVSMTELADQLSRMVDRPVINKTGLTGFFDLKLEYSPVESQSTAPAPDLPAPDIFTAVQEQLGLKLEATKTQVDVLVIDHAEKPSEN